MHIKSFLQTHEIKNFLNYPNATITTTTSDSKLMDSIKAGDGSCQPSGYEHVKKVGS